MYTLDGLYDDAKNYLQGFLKAGLNFDGVAELNDTTLDASKVEATFAKRLGGDNRFRTATQRQQGLELEKQRIIKLFKDTKDFGKLLDLGDEYFFRYTRFEQQYEFAKDQNSYGLEEIKKKYDNELLSNPNARWGLRVDKLTGGAKDVTEFFKVNGEKTAENVIMMAFDFLTYQPDLQFECISFMTGVVRACSNLLA
jgi:hypothetical protein